MLVERIPKRANCCIATRKARTCNNAMDPKTGKINKRQGKARQDKTHKTYKMVVMDKGKCKGQGARAKSKMVKGQ